MTGRLLCDRFGGARASGRAGRNGAVIRVHCGSCRWVPCPGRCPGWGGRPGTPALTAPPPCRRLAALQRSMRKEAAVCGEAGVAVPEPPLLCSHGPLVTRARRGRPPRWLLGTPRPPAPQARESRADRSRAPAETPWGRGLACTGPAGGPLVWGVFETDGESPAAGVCREGACTGTHVSRTFQAASLP